MKKVVMTVLVGLGFAGLQSKHYYVARVINNFLSESDKEKYINAKNQIKLIGDDMNHKCTDMCQKDDDSRFGDKINNQTFDDGTGLRQEISNHCVWDTKNTCICRAKYNDGHYYTTGKTFTMTNKDYTKYYLIVSSANDKCDSECSEKGLGDHGHNIYNPNNNTCACRVK